MKTAMQKHIEFLNDQLQICYDDGYSESWIFAYQTAIKNAENLLEKEKKLIAQAFDDGEHSYFYSKKTGKDFENGLEYYNENFHLTNTTTNFKQQEQ